ncbi:MAG: PilZ domain-containing protein [Ignavibacteriota bacterium]
MSANHQLPVEPVRSKGQATLQPAGHPEFYADIRDISASGIGVIAANAVDPGTMVRILIHDYAAQGIVHMCRTDDDGFYIGITLAA